MYLAWVLRDQRLRGFVLDRIASKAGDWRVDELMKVGNADYFERWLQPDSSRKARSNYENFLKEARTSRATSRTIHQELDDGWLNEAILTLVRHERSTTPAAGAEIDPIGFLLAKKWNGLVNLTANAARTGHSRGTVLVEDQLTYQKGDLLLA